ncbi:toll/interleukin-1 receptor domain-containing protein [Mesorhizobium sp. GbtcB19]|uniref:toll/interleukin-1 receptor domain-containing protein n=1 Tax=Mesorhizobium sp. GbtcB19 TaxID=2824764 RepID=UPI001C2F3D1D|nr:toll/interleukin-1 receptor domain-containing protein [Mesorhizobium sp. GbtcB19]
MPDQASIADRSFAPVAHVTRQRRLFELIKVGDSIWLAGCYPVLSPAAASIIGRIVVAEKTMENSVLRFAAAPGSYWLAWNDASQLMKTLEFDNKGIARALNVDVGIAQQLQTTRKVSNAHCETLEAYASEIRRRPMIFVSYRWTASTDVMRFLLPGLEAVGYSVWIDRWSGPRRFKGGRTNQPENIVKQLLSTAMGQCCAMVAIVDENYYNSEWTSFEYATASTIGVPTYGFSDVWLRNAYQANDLIDNLRDVLPRK